MSKTWFNTVQKNYESLEELKAYDESFSIVARCGFESAEEMWKKNPVIGGSVNPSDFGIVYKMLFNTGVVHRNRCDKFGKLIVNEFDVWKGGVLHIAYYIESEVPEGYKVDYLCQEGYPANENQILIKIVGGGMLSAYCVCSKKVG